MSLISAGSISLDSTFKQMNRNMVEKGRKRTERKRQRNGDGFKKGTDTERSGTLLNGEKDRKRGKGGGRRRGKREKTRKRRGKSVKKAVGIRNGYGLEKGTDTERSAT